MAHEERNTFSRRSFCNGLMALPLAGMLPTMAGQQAGASAAAQATRRSEIYALHQKSIGPLFDASGKWTAPSTPPIGRERLWNCFSLLSNPGTRDHANVILERTFADRSTFHFDFSIFEYSASAQLLVKNREHLTPRNTQLLRSLVEEGLKPKPDIRFLGYNDNFPAMNNVTATLGGEVVGDEPARRRGLEGMHRLLELLDRRTFLSEYTSSTYCPVTMLCYADIAQYSQDPQARELALEIERRVWFDIATHFHAPTNILAGPHSRAYMVDTVGHLHQAQMMLYIAYGNRLWMNPTRFMFPPVPGQVIHHDGDVPFMQASTVFISSGTYHPAPATERLLFDKQYPYSVSGTSEFGCGAESIWIRDANGGKPSKTNDVFEYPAGSLVSTTYMTQDYAVGSATAPFLDGNQTDVFFINFRRSEKPSTLADVSTIFTRYTYDDQGPGKPWTDPRNPGVEVTTSLLGEEGRVRAVQKKNTVLVAYQSKGQFLGKYRGLRLTIVVPVFYRPLRRLLFDGKPVELPFHSEEPGVVAIEDDFLYCAFRPLEITNAGRKAAVRIEQAHGFLSIHLVNYEGDGKEFGRRDLLGLRNGFVAEVAGRSDFPSFESFAALYQQGQVTDDVRAAQRAIEYRRPGVALALAHSVTYDGLKYALVDNREITGASRPG